MSFKNSLTPLTPFESKLVLSCNNSKPSSNAFRLSLITTLPVFVVAWLIFSSSSVIFTQDVKEESSRLGLL